MLRLSIDCFSVQKPGVLIVTCQNLKQTNKQTRQKLNSNTNNKPTTNQTNNNDFYNICKDFVSVGSSTDTGHTYHVYAVYSQTKKKQTNKQTGKPTNKHPTNKQTNKQCPHPRCRLLQNSDIHESM